MSFFFFIFNLDINHFFQATANATRFIAYILETKKSILG